VPLDDVYKFGAIKFLNAVSYLKAKGLYEEEINRVWREKNNLKK